MQKSGGKRSDQHQDDTKRPVIFQSISRSHRVQISLHAPQSQVMEQAPNYLNYMPTQFGPPQSYMGEQFQQQYHEDYNFHEQHPPVDPFMDAVNAEVWAAVQAHHSMDAQSLHQAYANLGFVLGIDRACTYFVQSYSSANPAYGGSRRTAKLFFKKDWENLEAMVAADVDNEKKIIHVEEFMKRRRIPGYVSLYAPKQIVCEKLQVKQEKISCVDDACHTRDEVMRLDVACQTQDQSTISLNVACQTEKFRSLETGCQTERFVSLETSCQTESFVNLDVACQTVEKFVGLRVSCQTCEKPSCESVDKVVRKGSDNRKRAPENEQDSRSTKRSKHSDSAGDACNKAFNQDAKSSTHQNGSGRTEESEHKSRAKDDKIVPENSDSHKHPRVHEAETSATGGKHPFLSGQTIHQMRRKLRKAKSLYESKKKIMEAVDNERFSHARKDSSDNSNHDGKLETCGTERSVSQSKRSNSKDSSQKREAVKSSASKTDAVDSEKPSSKSKEKIVPKDSSDNCKRARGHKSETCSTDRPESHAERSNSKDSAQKCEATKSSASKTDAVDGEKTPSKSIEKIVPKDSSDNCKRARGDKSEICSTNRSKSHAKPSNSKASAKKCEATKSSASKNDSRPTTEAVESKKSSRDSDVTSKVLNDPKDSGGIAETKKSSSHCKENSESSGCHDTKLVIQNLHPLVNDADISTIFSVFKSYKSNKVNFYDYSKLCAADVIFEEEADALEAKKQFDGKKLDGYPMHIVVVKSEKN